MQHGWQGAVIKALRGRDFTLEVVSAQDVGGRYRRVRVRDGGLLAACPPHPTMWVRLWFTGGGRPHQRAFTVVDPDPVAGSFDLEFALHDGVAAAWSLSAQPGDRLDATVYGTRFDPLPDPVRRLHLVGDPASLPAVNSVLDAHPGTPATVVLEQGHPDDRALPVRARAGHDVTWVPRGEGPAAGTALVEHVRSGWAAGADARADWFWLGCEAASTRALSRHLRRDLGVPKERVSALGYWRDEA
ncbi:siderophore-interacting protein [Pseudokineococcus sp. 5B2Z-1]|uniref:siderophore-interacting protein n=1 Tax=Pseudokineococcus sp. 5B2Z-1 TaxID=3132744 RepID=UPI003094CB9C